MQDEQSPAAEVWAKEVLERAPASAVVQAVAAGLLGGTSHDALLAAGGAAASLALDVAERVRRSRRKRVEDALHSAALMSGLSEEQLLSAVSSDDRLLHLAGTVLEAASRVAESERLKALARTLVNGIADGDRVDNERLVAQAVATLEPPHLQVLARLSYPQPGSSAAFSRHPPYPRAVLEATLPGASEVLDPIMATLESQGLVWSKGTDHFAKREWTITDFGRRCLQRLVAEGLVLSRPSSDRRRDNV